jgi:hypothetical protein
MVLAVEHLSHEEVRSEKKEPLKPFCQCVVYEDWRKLAVGRKYRQVAPRKSILWFKKK